VRDLFATPFGCVSSVASLNDWLALLVVDARQASAMSDKTTLAREKRDVARRARRLANTLLAEDDRSRLTRFADELDREAAALEQSTAVFVLKPDVTSHQQTQQQQVQQQQQSAAADSDLTKEKD